MSDLLQGIATLTKQVQQTLNSYEVRKLGDKVQGYVMNFTETEQKVREATNEDPWGPTGPEMQEIASLTFQYDQFSEVMGMLWKRMLQDNKMAWRRVYKSLVLLNYLLKNGSERVISAARDHSFEMRSLESYKCIDERGKDEGINVRHRVKIILELLNDEEMLRTERRKTKSEGREKYQGYSKEDMLGRGAGASKFDSFKSWNENKCRKDFDKERNNNHELAHNDGGGRREVTAFDFDYENSRTHANGSPELGIRERTPEPIENDDDEEFGDFTSARVRSPIFTNTQVPMLSTPPTNIKSSGSTHDPKVVFQNTSNFASEATEVDLLGLNEFNTGKYAAKSQQPPIDIIDNIFTDASVVHNDAQIHTNRMPDITDLLSSSPKSGKTAPLSNHLEDGVTTTTATSSSDIFKGKNNAGSNSPKMPNTWDDFKGKVNIDFENLSLKSPTKANPSLNELKMQMTAKGSSPVNFL